MKPLALLLMPLLLVAPMMATAQAAKPHELEDFIRRQQFRQLKISPTGEYLAATVPIGRKTALVILRRADNKVLANLSIPGDRTQVEDFWWVNNERVLLSAAEKIGALEAPQSTGDLYAINFDGSGGGLLVGQSLMVDHTNSHIQTKQEGDVAADLVDDLPADDKNAIISITPFTDDPYTRAERMNVYSGRRVTIAQAPVRNASFVTDHAGNVRFAIGEDIDLSRRLYHRAVDSKEWTLVSDTRADGLAKVPLGFSPDDKIAYLRVEHADGPDSIDAWDPATGQSHEVFRDDDTDPQALYVGDRLVGVEVLDGLPRREFFDPESKYAKLYRKLERAFQGQDIAITSVTADESLALVFVHSDRNPGDFYLFDTNSNKASYLLSRGQWIDPERTAQTRPVQFAARDGKTLHGFLTAPVGAEAKNAPMILYVHGGPFGIHDEWGYDSDVQMLAAHGYAVLQVNFRGSGNHGRAFEEAGRRQWGGAMQDDLTDATRWAIQQGIADPRRICIYGASYGAYASLMGVVKEPTLYRCAAGYVGVYDLPTMHTDGDIKETGSGKNYVAEWIGSPDDIAKVSPNRLADRIKVPVLLAAGGEDERAPIQHTQMMEKALRAAGVPVEAYYYPTEGHGFYKVENERDYYGKLLAFFQKQLGGRAPVVVAGDGKR